jgi:hypothetical protein
MLRFEDTEIEFVKQEILPFWKSEPVSKNGTLEDEIKPWFHY